MALLIIEECINCGACEDECPNDAISEGDDVYVIDSECCTECVGAFDEPKCIEVCPIEDCIPKDPDHSESREVLMARYELLHPKEG